MGYLKSFARLGLVVLGTSMYLKYFEPKVQKPEDKLVSQNYTVEKAEPQKNHFAINHNNHPTPAHAKSISAPPQKRYFPPRPDNIAISPVQLSEYQSLIQKIKSDIQSIPDSKYEDYLNANLEKVISYWYGTPYSSGTTSVPKKGGIACGYFVSRVLKDVGYNIDQRAMGQQTGATIINSLCEPSTIRRFSGDSQERIEHYVKEQGKGFYIVGLETHVGLLYNNGEEVSFIHSSSERQGKLSRRLGVVKQRLEDSPGFIYSDSYMIGKLFTGKSLDKYLSDKQISP